MFSSRRCRFFVGGGGGCVIFSAVVDYIENQLTVHA